MVDPEDINLVFDKGDDNEKLGRGKNSLFQRAWFVLVFTKLAMLADLAFLYYRLRCIILYLSWHIKLRIIFYKTYEWL